MDQFSRMFWFQWPGLYFQTIMIQIMVISFYLALWVTNFGAASITSTHNKLWGLYSVLPGLLSAILYLYIVTCAALIKVGYYFHYRVYLTAPNLLLPPPAPLSLNLYFVTILSVW